MDDDLPRCQVFFPPDPITPTLPTPGHLQHYNAHQFTGVDEHPAPSYFDGLSGWSNYSQQAYSFAIPTTTFVGSPPTDETPLLHHQQQQQFFHLPNQHTVQHNHHHHHEQQLQVSAGPHSTSAQRGDFEPLVASDQPQQQVTSYALVSPASATDCSRSRQLELQTEKANQIVPTVCPPKSTFENSKSKGDEVFSYKDERVTTAHQSAQVHIPSREVDPGHYGFKVNFKSSSKTSYSFSDDTKVLCTNKGVDFAAIFSFSERPPAHFSVRTLVCCKNEKDIRTIGVVRKCAMHPEKSKGCNYFLTCRNEQAVYGEHHSHSIITVPLDSMAECDLGSCCTYACGCYSTCVVGKGANRPTLVIVFSLIDSVSRSVVAQDIINLRCCASPKRDARKRKESKDGGVAKRTKKESHCNSSSPQQGAMIVPKPESLPDKMNLVTDQQPDEDGYFTFTWRTKDRGLFNWLNILKQGHQSSKKSS